MTVKNAADNELREVKRLYYSAFPEAERKPFDLILEKCKEKSAEILVICEDGFAGFAVILSYKDRVLMDYFAVDESKRGRNIGSNALKLIMERYRQKRFVLEIELPDEKSADNSEKIRRKAFYLRNGMVPSGIRIVLNGVPMELLTGGSEITFEEYCEIYSGIFGSDKLKDGILEPKKA